MLCKCQSLRQSAAVLPSEMYGDMAASQVYQQVRLINTMQTDEPLWGSVLFTLSFTALSTLNTFSVFSLREGNEKRRNCISAKHSEKCFQKLSKAFSFSSEMQQVTCSYCRIRCPSKHSKKWKYLQLWLKNAGNSFHLHYTKVCCLRAYAPVGVYQHCLEETHNGN